MSKGMIKERAEELYGWWDRDKLSGTLLFILLPFMLTKMVMETSYTFNELVFVASLTGIIMTSVAFYYYRDSKISVQLIEYRTRIKELNHAIDKFEQQVVVENFAMDTILKEKEKQFRMIQEDFNEIQEQIMDKVDHIVYLSREFDPSPRIDKLVEMHLDEISRLREYRRKLPQMIRLSFKDYIDSSSVPKVRTKPTEIRDELQTLISEVKLMTGMVDRVDEIEKELEENSDINDYEKNLDEIDEDLSQD